MKTFAALLVAALALSSGQAFADECHFENGAQTLYFTSPVDVKVEGPSHYTCSTSSAGTGVAGRMARCDDGFSGPMIYNEDESITFRDETWKEACDEATDLMGN